MPPTLANLGPCLAPPPWGACTLGRWGFGLPNLEFLSAPASAGRLLSSPRVTRAMHILTGLGLLLSPQVSAKTGPLTLETNNRWELFTAPEDDAARRQILERASTMLQAWPIDFAGVPITAERLAEIARSPTEEPLLRTTRELLRRPVDLDDFLLFLDDLLLAGARGLPRTPVVLPPGRARNAGLLLHPHDIFKPERAPHYGEGEGALLLSAPTSQSGLRAAKNGSVVGPRWAARYRQPGTQQGRLRALAKVNPDFAARITSLAKQLKDQGAWVLVESTLRRRERGFLIYGSYWLGQADSARDVKKRIRRLDRLERELGLRVPIRWRHPRGWRATVQAAHALAETYGVDYATVGGAKKSDHYDGRAIDMWAVDLPRQLTLRAPDGAVQTFDLSGPQEPRDLSLTPVLIEWIETHFVLKKLLGDYPHWGDEAPLPE